MVPSLKEIAQVKRDRPGDFFFKKKRDRPGDFFFDTTQKVVVKGSFGIVSGTFVFFNSPRGELALEQSGSGLQTRTEMAHPARFERATFGFVVPRVSVITAAYVVLSDRV